MRENYKPGRGAWSYIPGTKQVARLAWPSASGRAFPTPPTHTLPPAPPPARCGVCQGGNALSQYETLRRISLAVDCIGAQWVRYVIQVRLHLSRN